MSGSQTSQVIPLIPLHTLQVPVDGCGFYDAGGVTMRVLTEKRRARHSVLIIWVVVLIAAALLWQQLGSHLTPRISLLHQTSAMQGRELIDRQRHRDQSSIRVVCAITASTISSPAIDESIEPGQIQIDLAGVGDCYRQRWHLAGQQPIADDLSSDVQSAANRFLIPPEMLDSLRAQDSGGDIAKHLRDTALSDLWHAERASIPIAFLVLVVITGSFAAASIPLALAIWSSVVAIGLLLLISQHAVSMYAVNVTTMIGLAVGMDYTLLCLQRYREERRHGATSQQHALERSQSTAGRAVALSGLIVIVSFGGLLIVPINVFRDVSIGAVIVVCLNILMVFTVFPVIVRTMEDLHHTRITARDAPRLYRVPGGIADRVWPWVSRLVTRKPIICIVAVMLILVPLATQTMTMRGQISIPGVTTSGLTEATTMDTYVAQEVNASLLSVVEIIVDQPPEIDRRMSMENMLHAIGMDDDFAPIVAIEGSGDDSVIVVRALVVYPAGSTQATAALQRLQTDIVPGASADTATTVFVSGPLAAYADVLQAIRHWTWWIVAGVMAVSTVLLGFAFRSLWMAILAVATTLLSVAAAIGAVVLIVQKGIGASFLGVAAATGIEQWIPIVVFCVVFGLSMDYHIFLVSRIREDMEIRGDVIMAIQTGIRTTGGVICSAALIMAIVFAGAAHGSIPMLQQAGLGLAIAVMIDAFLSRLILVPACLSVFRRDR